MGSAIQFVKALFTFGGMVKLPKALAVLAGTVVGGLVTGFVIESALNEAKDFMKSGGGENTEQENTVKMWPGLKL